jgi:hypothetical protein
MNERQVSGSHMMAANVRVWVTVILVVGAAMGSRPINR